MDWFLYDKDLHHEKAKTKHAYINKLYYFSIG